MSLERTMSIPKPGNTRLTDAVLMVDVDAFFVVVLPMTSIVLVIPMVLNDV